MYIHLQTVFQLQGACCLFFKNTWAHGPRNYDIHPVNPWGLAILLYNACCPKGAGLVPKTLLLQLKIKCMNRRLHCISSRSMWILVSGTHISHGRTAKYNCSANSPSTHKREVLIKWPRHSASKSGASNTCDCTPPKTSLHFIANCPKPKKISGTHPILRHKRSHLVGKLLRWNRQLRIILRCKRHISVGHGQNPQL